MLEKSDSMHVDDQIHRLSADLGPEAIHIQIIPKGKHGRRKEKGDINVESDEHVQAIKTQKRRLRKVKKPKNLGVVDEHGVTGPDQDGESNLTPEGTAQDDGIVDENVHVLKKQKQRLKRVKRRSPSTNQLTGDSDAASGRGGELSEVLGPDSEPVKDADIDIQVVKQKRRLKKVDKS